jgi:chromosome segregation ATPase
LKKRLEQRLVALKDEFESGKRMLADLEARQNTLRETLLRIRGAIQVLEEELENLNDAPTESAQATNSASAPPGVPDSLPVDVKVEQ